MADLNTDEADRKLERAIAAGDAVSAGIVAAVALFIIGGLIYVAAQALTSAL